MEKYLKKIKSTRSFNSKNEIIALGYYLKGLSYIETENYPKAKSFFNSREDFGEDGAMVLLYLVAALMAGEEEIAEDLFEELLATIDGFEYLAVQRDFPFDEVQQVALHSAYMPGTVSEIYWAFFAIFPVTLVAGPYI